MNLAKSLILIALLAGCTKSSESRSSATRPEAANATQPTLKPIDLLSGVYLARMEVHITVTPEGLLRSVNTMGKSYGPKDLDPSHQRIEVRQGQMSADEMTDLARRFENWNALSSDRYGGVPDGGEISIRYGDKTVAGGSDVPPQVREIHQAIGKLTLRMPIVPQ